MIDVEREGSALHKHSTCLRKKLFIPLVASSLLACNAARADVGDMLGVPFLHAFGDAGWGAATQNQSSRLYDRGFYLGVLDFYIDPDLGEHIRFLSEVAIDPDWSSESEGIDAERLQVGYSFNKNITAWVGRFHTPLGYWSTAYHHAAELQTSVYRPRFIDFEDKYGVLPVHTTGLWLVGTAYVSDEDRIGYQFFLGNGNRLQTDTNSGFTNLEMEIAHQAVNSASVGFKFNYYFGGALDGLQAGVCGMLDSIQSDPTTANPYSGAAVGTVQPLMKLGNVFAVYEGHGFESISEMYGFANSDQLHPGSTYGSWAGFSQLGYAFEGVSVPYIRFEDANFNQADPFFASQTNGVSYNREALGFRYNLNDRAAVKMELNHTNIQSSRLSGAGGLGVSAGAYNEIRTQYAVQF